MALARDRGEQPHTVGRAEARSEGGSDLETWAACRRSREGARGEGGGRGEAKGEKVGRVRALGAVKAYTGGGGRWCSGCAGGVSRAQDRGRGSGPERRSAPARCLSCGRGKWEARKVAQARVGRLGALEAGRVSGRASQLCLRATGNMAPRTALPYVGAEGAVRP